VTERNVTEWSKTMSKRELSSGAVELPEYLMEVLSDQPQNVDRRVGAELVTRHLFPVSRRTLEAWPLPTRHVNGKAIVPTRALFEVAFAKMSAAPVVMGGRGAVAVRQIEPT
jgi:hypothetical protein